MRTTNSATYVWALLGCFYLETLAMCEVRPDQATDYSHRGLSSIPTNINPDAVSVDVSHNYIRVVPSRAMEGIIRLRKLDLSRNKIQKLDSFAFSGLSELCFLDLSGNNLSMGYDSFPRPLFVQLLNLQILHIENNIFPGPENTSYPDETIQHLEHLRVLYADSFAGLHLGHGFCSLSYIEEFHSSVGVIGTIANDTMSPLVGSRLKKLILVACGIETIETGAFLYLKHLEHLDLSHNAYLGLTKALTCLFGLQHHNMTDVIFAEVNSVHTKYQDSLLDENSVRYLQNICVLNLDLSQNRITYVNMKTIADLKFPNCIRRLTIAGHQIIQIRALSWTKIILQLRRFTFLEYLDLSHFHLSSKKSQRTSLDRGIIRSRAQKDSELGSIWTFYFPSSLRFLNISGLFNDWAFIPSFGFQNADKLRILDMSFAGLHTCISPIVGFGNVTVFNMTEIDCSVLAPDFLSTFPNLEVLELPRIGLKSGLLSDKEGKLFSHQVKLRSLNMADNGLINLHPKLFTNQQLLQNLNLGDNKLSEIPIAVQSLSSMRRLDMSYNAITSLTDSDRKWLDELSGPNNKFHLSLYGNPLSCTCSSLEFLIWLLEGNIQLDAKNDLTCTAANGTLVLVVDLAGDLNNMKVECVSRLWLIFSISGSSVVFAALCIGIVCFRYRYNVKYWFLTKCRGRQQYNEIPLENFAYDAFVGYNHVDYRWTCFPLREFLEDTHGYRLCLHHRDFPVGESIQGNIVDALKASRKVILVISKMYLSCEWGEFEIEMAIRHAVQSGNDNVLIVIMLEEIPVRQMPRSLMRMWDTITFLLWTNEACDEHTLWRRLEEAVARR